MQALFLCTVTVDIHMMTVAAFPENDKFVFFFGTMSQSRLPNFYSLMPDVKNNHTMPKVIKVSKDQARGYKTFFMLSSAESKIYPAHKC